MPPTVPPALTRAQARAKRPVFVDRSGRRMRIARAVTLSGVGLIFAYVAIVIASFFGVPTIVSPLLPHPPVVQAVAPVPTPSATPSPRPSPIAELLPADRPAASTPLNVSQTPGPAPSAAPVAAPAPTPSSPGNSQSTSEHGKSASAPGQSTTPTPPAKP